MDPVLRRELTRFGAPAAFLAAGTIAVLLIKAGLNNGSDSHRKTIGASTTTVSTAAAPGATTKLVLSTPTIATTPAEYYVIQSGDTLGGIASKYDTTVEQLLTLNPSLDPDALHPGDRIRVG
jgi:LysM repeat protein